MNIDEYRAMKAAEESKKDQPEPTPEPVVEPVVEEPKTPEPEVTPQPEPTPAATPDKLVVDGEEITLDDIREWRYGNMLQQDYTRKTQEIAHQREEAKQAIELFNYLKENPHLAQTLLEANKGAGNTPARNVDPIVSHVQKLEKQVTDLMIEREIDQLSRKYSDFDVIEVLKVASENPSIKNLEDAYKMVKAEKILNNPESTKSVDEESIRKQIREELLRELEAERTSTQTIISSNGNKAPEPKKEITLTEAEKKIARNLRLTDEEYIKWKTKR